MKVEEFSTYINELEASEDISDEALEASADALAFAQSLWDLFRANGLVVESDKPNFATMEKVIDLLYGELHAVTVFFSEDSFSQLPEVFDGVAHKLEEAQQAAGGHIPPEVIRGNRDFATRLRNARAYRKSRDSED